MNDLESYMNSGVLELFALGALEPHEAAEVEVMITNHPEVREALRVIEEGIEKMADLDAISPPQSLKASILGKIDAIEEAAFDPVHPPVLTPDSTADDYAYWINDPSFVAPKEFEDPFFIPIAQNEDGATVMVWIQNSIPVETHVDVVEKFLILEGSCDISYGGEVHSLKAGDYLSIPLHHPHTVKITSDIPCKLIVQRIAA